MDNEPITQPAVSQTPPIATTLQTNQAPQQPPTATTTNPDSNKIITILLLIFLYPVGLVFMWIRMKNWPTWLKALITAPLVLSVIGIIATLLFVMFVPVNFV